MCVLDVEDAPMQISYTDDPSTYLPEKDGASVEFSFMSGKGMTNLKIVRKNESAYWLTLCRPNEVVPFWTDELSPTTIQDSLFTLSIDYKGKL
jgi:hypothetical protein